MKLHMLLLLAAAALCAVQAQAHDYNVAYTESPGSKLTLTWVDNNLADLHYFALPKTGTQQFFTASSLNPSYESQYPNNKFSLDRVLTEFNISRRELMNGDANATKEGCTTSQVVPEGAKITSLTLPGQWLGGSKNAVVDAYLKNASNGTLNVDMGHDAVVARAGQCYANAQAVELGQDGKLMALTLNDSKGTPFAYDGNDMILSIDTQVSEGASQFAWATASAEKNLATAIHGQSAGKDVFNTSAGESYGTAGAVATFMQLKRNQAPAIEATYYTNDVKFKITDNEGNIINDTISDKQPNGRPFVRLKQGNTVIGIHEVDENGEYTFQGVDYTKTYNISVASNSYGYIETDGIRFDDAGRKVENDIVVEVKFHLMPGFEPPFGGVESVEAKALRVWGGNGEIGIEAETATPITVCDLMGRVARRLTAEPGRTSIDGLAPGIYVVNRTKVIVK